MVQSGEVQKVNMGAGDKWWREQEVLGRVEMMVCVMSGNKIGDVAWGGILNGFLCY